MAYTFEPGKLYRMPTHFGPSLGPRQGPDGRKFTCKTGPHKTAYSVSFVTNPEQLEKLLPDRFELAGEPVVTVLVAYMTGIEWLAGRGYNVLGVIFPAAFNGDRDQVQGSFLSVLWENLADAIISGREELGFSKVYCEIPDPVIRDDETQCIGSWFDFKFMDMKIRNMTQVPPEKMDPTAGEGSGDGLLHYKYIPRTGEWGTADVSYAVLTPYDQPNCVVKERWQGEGTVEFHKAAWEDLPTTCHIVNALHELEIREYRGASIVKSVGAKDLGDQRILQ
jgi:acetoacetate decarboxylase